MGKTKINLPNFIVDGICKKDEQVICNIGYACDGCPYNEDNKLELHDVSLVKEEGIPLQDKIVECYCCGKEYKESEGSWISATTSGKCNDKTDAENRFVCNKCNKETTSNE